MLKSGCAFGSARRVSGVATLSLSTQHSPETLPCTGHTMLSLPPAGRWPDCPSRRAFGSKAVTARAVGHEGAAQIIPNSTNVRLVRSMQTRVHTRVRQLLGRSAGET